MAKASFHFRPNEAVILRTTDVYRVTTNTRINCELILSNERFAFIYGDFKKKTAEYTLQQVKIFNEKAQVMMGDYYDELTLEVYFTDGKHERFEIFVRDEEDEDDDDDSVVGAFKEIGTAFFGQSKSKRQAAKEAERREKERKKNEVQKWVDAVNRAVLGDFSPADAHQASASQARSTPATGNRAARKCTSCSAPISGHKGGIVRCEYCDSDQLL